MFEIGLNAEQLIKALLQLSEAGPICILDSCGVSHLGSHRLIAGIQPVEVMELNSRSDDSVNNILDAFTDKLQSRHLAGIFTLSYDLGRKLLQIPSRHIAAAEPDVFLALFDHLIVHDYETGLTSLHGNSDKYAATVNLLRDAAREKVIAPRIAAPARVASNFSPRSYFDAIEAIRERIRSGDTYQTNLTQQFTAEIPSELSPAEVFQRLRSDHPAAFAAYINRPHSTVVSASPERFFKVEKGAITVSPVKGTRRRGQTPADDERLRNELLSSLKDRAENTMIVDLLRNDLGRVCEFGTVKVEKLHDLEVHPTLFHLVSTVSGKLRADVGFKEIIRALFPSGSITGAPKIRTMQIINELEPACRGLSMGAIGYLIPETFGVSDVVCDVNVAIRTMTFRKNTVSFNTGGGIVIDSDPESEYRESLLKAKALLQALNAGELHF